MLLVRLLLLPLLAALAILGAFPAPSPPYRGPAYRRSSGSNRPINRIVIHSTVSPTSAGWAERIAAYFRSSSAGGSAHYVVDAAATLQSVYDSVIAWHAPPNSNSIGVELCDYPTNLNAHRWRGKDHQAMLTLAVDLVARLCLANDVPIRYVAARGLRAGRRGITTHNQVSEAFGQSSHWDPGAWPRRRFVRRVRRRARELERAQRAPRTNGKGRRR